MKRPALQSKRVRLQFDRQLAVPGPCPVFLTASDVAIHHQSSDSSMCQYVPQLINQIWYVFKRYLVFWNKTASLESFFRNRFYHLRPPFTNGWRKALTDTKDG